MEINDGSERRWNQFLSEIRAARSRFGNGKEIWYRGVSNQSYQPVPSLLRRPGLAEHERWMFEEFERLSLRFLREPVCDWQTLFAMQHYGVPTRLLDWTDVLGIAVFFAVGSSARDLDGAVYVLDPAALCQASGQASITEVGEGRPTDISYKRVFWDGVPFKPSRPLPVRGASLLRQNERQFAQRGMFTVHSPILNAQEGMPAIEKVVLPRSARASAVEFLSAANLNASTLFPDLFGVADHVSRTADALASQLRKT
jgi:hypothetical protein